MVTPLDLLNEWKDYLVILNRWVFISYIVGPHKAIWLPLGTYSSKLLEK